MVAFDTEVRIEKIEKNLEEVSKKVDAVLKVVKAEEDLWDNSELIRRWNVSERTLASWRSKGLISYVQVNGKIWYPRVAREEFLVRNLISN